MNISDQFTFRMKRFQRAGTSSSVRVFHFYRVRRSDFSWCRGAACATHSDGFSPASTPCHRSLDATACMDPWLEPGHGLGGPGRDCDRERPVREVRALPRGRRARRQPGWVPRGGAERARTLAGAMQSGGRSESNGLILPLIK